MSVIEMNPTRRPSSSRQLAQRLLRMRGHRARDHQVAHLQARDQAINANTIAQLPLRPTLTPPIPPSVNVGFSGPPPYARTWMVRRPHISLSTSGEVLRRGPHGRFELVDPTGKSAT
jgi:hypothetical protein